MTTGCIKLERLMFSKTQRLYASSMQTIEQVNREMLWLHNRSLHQRGIGSGFAVSGEIGDREVRVEPGYAIDSEGREIVLTKSSLLPVPPVAGSENNLAAFYDLTVSYPEEQNLEEVETRQGVCHERGTVRLREEPDFCWIKLDPGKDFQPESDELKNEIKKGLRIIISRAEIQDCKLRKEISIAQRQNAKPVKGPNIVSGSYVPKPDEWKIWKIEEANPLGLKISIDTSNANLTTPPNYYAEIVGQKLVTTSIDKITEYPYIIEGFANVIVPQENGKHSTDRFDLYILMPKMSLPEDLIINPDHFLHHGDEFCQGIINSLGWYIEWMAVEG